MDLNDVRFGHSYHCDAYCDCCLVASYHDDGALLIIELFLDGDLSGVLKTVEAWELSPMENK